MEKKPDPRDDERTIPERGKEWETMLQSPYSDSAISVEAELIESLTEETIAPRFQGDILLKHYESHTEFRIPNQALQLPFVLGRADLNTGFLPLVNLTSLDEKHKTVSRRHAIIRPHRELLVVVDQKSLNGTFLNSQRLIPGQAWILRNGDMLRLGKICLILYFIAENEKAAPFSGTASHSNR